MAEDDEPLEDEPEEEEPEEPGDGDGTEELPDEEEGAPGDTAPLPDGALVWGRYEGPTMADVERWLDEKGRPTHDLALLVLWATYGAARASGIDAPPPADIEELCDLVVRIGQRAEGRLWQWQDLPADPEFLP